MDLDLLPTPCQSEPVEDHKEQFADPIAHYLTNNLLPTPKVTEIAENYDRWRERMEKSGNPKNIGKTIPGLATLVKSGILDFKTENFDQTTKTVTPSGDEEHKEQFADPIAHYLTNSILPTPKVGGNEKYATRAARQGHAKAMSHLQSAVEFIKSCDMLPTPVASNSKSGHKHISPRIERKLSEGRTIELNDLAGLDMLPTPNSNDSKNCGNPDNPSIQRRKELGKQLDLSMHVSGDLNPRFVAEMMGFPPDYLELPFLSDSGDHYEGEFTLMSFDYFPSQSPSVVWSQAMKGKLKNNFKKSSRKHQEACLKAYGNAVVPHVPLAIFTIIDKFIKNQI